MGLIFGFLGAGIGIVLGVVISIFLGISDKKENPDSLFLVSFLKHALTVVPAFTVGGVFVSIWLAINYFQ